MKDLKNYSLDKIIQWKSENLVGDHEILVWLNYHYGREKQFWYGSRDLSAAVCMAMINGIGFKDGLVVRGNHEN